MSIILSVFTFISFSALSYFEIGGASVNQRLQGKYRGFNPGGWGQTLLRFRDIKKYSHADVIFAGSSHTYRGFDPRIFDNENLKSFNTGSTSQTPLNTYFILKKYLPLLSPKIIILELYPNGLTVDGYESFTDLATNLEFSPEIIEMALSLKSLNAIKSLFEIYIKRIKKPLNKINQKIIENETYISGGYCESLSCRKNDDPSPEPKEFILLDSQLNHLVKIIELSKKYNSELLVVIHPLPRDHFLSIKNYNQVSTRLKDMIEKNDSEYIDFNYILPLDSHDHFKDDDHLNSAGVKLFNAALIDVLKKHTRYQNIFPP